MGQGEYDVEVGDAEEFFLSCGEPALASLCLALRDSAGSGRSYKRWPDDRIASIDRCGRPARPFGSVVIARSTLSCW